MTASIILKKFIFKPIKKAVKWYLEQTEKSVNHVCMTGTFPPAYYELIFEERRRKEESRK